MNHDILIYSTKTCSYCLAAKGLLDRKGIPFKEIDLTGNDALRAKLVNRTGSRTVPQIFIGGEFIGGYHELRRINLDQIAT